MASGPGTALALDHLLCSQNLQAEVSVPPGTPITYSAFENQNVPGTGNLQGDPRLVRPFYKLRADSPCIDAGDQGAALPTTDYEGDPRSVLGRPGPTARPDLGADEFIATGSAHTFGVPGFGAAAFHPEIGTPDTTVRIGQPFRVEIRNAVDFNSVPADGVVIVISSQEDAGILLADLSGIGAPGSFLFQNLRAVAAAPPVAASGLATATINVPNSSELHGVPVTLQGLLTKPGANAAGVVTTQGLRVTIGR